MSERVATNGPVDGADAVDDLAAALAASPAHPGFAEPWHAEVFAFTHALSRRGLFTWTTWADTFSRVIATAPQAPGEGIESAYFRQWLTALETLLARAGVCDTDAVDALAARWRAAFLHTPHGQAVALAHAEAPSARVAHHAQRGQPVAVAPAVRGR